MPYMLLFQIGPWLVLTSTFLHWWNFPLLFTNLCFTKMVSGITIVEIVDPLEWGGAQYGGIFLRLKTKYLLHIMRGIRPPGPSLRQQIFHLVTTSNFLLGKSNHYWEISCTFSRNHYCFFANLTESLLFNQKSRTLFYRVIYSLAFLNVSNTPYYHTTVILTLSV